MGLKCLLGHRWHKYNFNKLWGMPIKRKCLRCDKRQKVKFNRSKGGTAFFKWVKD